MKIVLFSLLPAVILLVLANVMAHMTIHRSTQTLTDTVTGTKYYTMSIGRLPWSPRSTTPLNSLGLPDEEFVNVLPKGECVHIVIAGDSFTFGDGVDRDRNWVTLVRRMYARHHPERCVRFFNIGERMTTIEQQARRVRETLPLLDPDLVVLVQYQNDITDLTMPGSAAYKPPVADEETNFWGDVLRTSIPGFSNSLVRMLTYRSFATLIKRDIQYDVLAQWSVLADSARRSQAEHLLSLYEDMYSDLMNELRGKGIDVAAISIPSKLDVMAKRYPEGEYFEELARDHNVTYLATMPVLNEQREIYTYQMYDGHLSEHGNKVVARSVLSWLLDESHAASFPYLHHSAAQNAQLCVAGSACDDSLVTPERRAESKLRGAP